MESVSKEKIEQQIKQIESQYFVASDILSKLIEDYCKNEIIKVLKKLLED